MKHFKVEPKDTFRSGRCRNPPMNYMTGRDDAGTARADRQTEADENTRALMITGGVEGKFITHYSVDELAAMAADPAECARVFPDAVRRLPPPARPHHADAESRHRGDQRRLHGRRVRARAGLRLSSRRGRPISNRAAGGGARDSSRGRRHAAPSAPDRTRAGARGDAVRQRLPVRARPSGWEW